MQAEAEALTRGGEVGAGDIQAMSEQLKVWEAEGPGSLRRELGALEPEVGAVTDVGRGCVCETFK